MTPATKESVLALVFLFLAGFLGLTIILNITGCAHDVVRHAPQESSITQAAAISDRIDDKAVIVQQWLKQN
jgi:hypothetical protein